MPAGPSGPAQPGVITAAVAATTAAGTAARAAARAAAPRGAAGRPARDGRHSSAAHPAISANSKTPLVTSSGPAGSAWCRSGPNGRPAVRDAAYTATTAAFPAMASSSQGRDGRHSSTAGQISWAHATTRKNTPYSASCAKCSNTTAKCRAAAPADSAARPPRKYGRTVPASVRASSPARTRVLMPLLICVVPPLNLENPASCRRSEAIACYSLRVYTQQLYTERIYSADGRVLPREPKSADGTDLPQ